MIDVEEERFFASESLQGVLTPAMLAEENKKTEDFFLVLEEMRYPIEAYTESPREIGLVLLCDADSLGPILSMSQKTLKIKSGKSVIERDVTRYDLSWEIVRSVDSSFKAILNFVQNQAGVING